MVIEVNCSPEGEGGVLLNVTIILGLRKRQFPTKNDLKLHKSPEGEGGVLPPEQGLFGTHFF